MAVGRDHKLAGARPVKGNVGHDRIQQAHGDQSIGQAIRYWYGIEGGRDFETIDVEVTIHSEGHFILVPTSVLMRGAKRKQLLEKIPSPLSFHRDHQSKLWRRQIEKRRNNSPGEVTWAAAQMARVVAGHQAPQAKHILESDLLRAAGALSMVGVVLGPYLGKGYDCLESRFEFDPLPMYSCPVEVKKRSQGFTYQVKKYTKLPRAVVLCLKHDLINPPDDIDVIELPVLADYLSR